MTPTLFVYVEGYDLDDIAKAIEPPLREFALRHCELGVTFINEREARGPKAKPEDLPRWDLGLNLPPAFVNSASFPSMLGMLRALSAKTERAFVIGISVSQGINEDIAYVEAQSTEATRDQVIAYLSALGR